MDIESEGINTKNKSVELVDGGNDQHHNNNNHQLFQHGCRIVQLFWLIVVAYFVIYHFAYPFQLFSKYSSFSLSPSSSLNKGSSSIDLKLKSVLEKAATEDKTVIITTLNEAWAAPNSTFDLFLESFRIGNEISRLLRNLVVVSFDQKAYDRCLALHPHCYLLNTVNGTDFTAEAYFMTANYLEMMWKRIDFLYTVLNMGYSFIFTDADIMWFRNPFPHFYLDGDFQSSCDEFWGNPLDLRNQPNGGFNYVKSNKRTIKFYKFWFDSRLTYPGLHDQDVLNKIKFDPFLSKIGLKIKFLDTAYFGGFCQPSRDLNKVCTMHANCCFGLDSKVHDLKVMLEDWRKYLSLQANKSSSQPTSWTVPQKCSLNSFHPPDLPKKNVQNGTNA